VYSCILVVAFVGKQNKSQKRQKTDKTECKVRMWGGADRQRKQQNCGADRTSDIWRQVSFSRWKRERKSRITKILLDLISGS